MNLGEDIAMRTSGLKIRGSNIKDNQVYFIEFPDSKLSIEGIRTVVEDLYSYLGIEQKERVSVVHVPPTDNNSRLKFSRIIFHPKGRWTGSFHSYDTEENFYDTLSSLVKQSKAVLYYPSSEKNVEQILNEYTLPQ
jgi:hypothetical protein